MAGPYLPEKKVAKNDRQKRKLCLLIFENG